MAISVCPPPPLPPARSRSWRGLPPGIGSAVRLDQRRIRLNGDMNARPDHRTVLRAALQFPVSNGRENRGFGRCVQGISESFAEPSQDQRMHAAANAVPLSAAAPTSSRPCRGQPAWPAFARPSRRIRVSALAMRRFGIAVLARAVSRRPTQASSNRGQPLTPYRRGIQSAGLTMLSKRASASFGRRTLRTGYSPLASRCCRNGPGRVQEFTHPAPVAALASAQRERSNYMRNHPASPCTAT